MRFSLQDVKKQVHRRGSELYVSLHFLRPNELHSEIERLIAYHEQGLGQPRRQFSLDDARACIGDYRLAHCLVSTLSAWYNWQQCDWSMVLQEKGGQAVGAGLAPALEAAGITSPVHLRLALFNYINEHYHGFLDTALRTAALETFAERYQLTVPDLEYLLVLDSDEEEILVRDAPYTGVINHAPTPAPQTGSPPSAQDVATLYNQWTFEAALFNASNVHFVIDCGAFEHTADIGPQINVPETGRVGVGAVIKRLCYLARLIGVYYDLAYDDASAFNAAPLLHLTLYGPQEMTGAPQQYGVRLARLCRMLLGYGLSQREHTKDAGRGVINRTGVINHAPTNTLTNAIVKAEATVHFLQRSYHFVIDNSVLSRLPSLPETNLADANGGTDVSGGYSPGRGVINHAPTINRPADAETSGMFDSSIEQSFAEAFSALENSHAVEGWRLLREPEPLLLDHSIFIPDFALTRSEKRIYVEILGFWTPAYRERKVQKLQQLQDREDIVLAIPNEAREAFASIAGSFPIVWYDGQLSATELLKLVRSCYDDFAERLASIDVAAVRKRVENEGWLPERACYELLHCYRRSELALAAKRVIGQDVAFVAGIGLYCVDWMEQLRTSFVEWIGNAGVLSLADVLRESRARWPRLANCEDATLEALLGLWSEIHVRRNSIFDATVEVIHQVANDNMDVEGQFIAPNNADLNRNVPTKKPAREKRSVQKKRIIKEATQGDLWG